MKKKFEYLLEKGESLLHENIDEELAKLTEGDGLAIVNPEKYEMAMEFFKEILVIDPENQRAKAGLKACDDMLEPYNPVQYMSPVEDIEINMDIIKSVHPTPAQDLAEGYMTHVNENDSGESKKENTAPRPLPWEFRRKRLNEVMARDRAGIRYTNEVFSHEKEKAKKEADAIIQMVVDNFYAGREKDAFQAFKDAKNKLEQLQENLNRSWKGHGPDILDLSLQVLKEKLGIG